MRTHTHIHMHIDILNGRYFLKYLYNQNNSTSTAVTIEKSAQPLWCHLTCLIWIAENEKCEFATNHNKTTAENVRHSSAAVRFVSTIHTINVALGSRVILHFLYSASSVQLCVSYIILSQQVFWFCFVKHVLETLSHVYSPQIQCHAGESIKYADSNGIEWDKMEKDCHLGIHHFVKDLIIN